MRIAAGVATICVASAVSPIAISQQAQLQAIRFVPPPDTPLTYRITQHVGTGKAQKRFEAVRTLRFAADGSGYRLTVTVTGVTGDAPATHMARYRAAMAPMIGMAQHLRVDAEGRIVGIDNMAELWMAFMSGQRALQAMSGHEDKAKQAEMRAAADYMEGLDDAGRLAVLIGDVQPLMLFASGTPLPLMNMVPGGDLRTAMFAEQDAANGVRARYAVDRGMGLVMHAERHVNRPPYIVHEIRMLERPTL